MGVTNRYTNWDEVSAIVDSDIVPEVTDQIYTSNVFYATLEDRNRVIVRGGESYTWPVMYDKLNAGSYRGTTPFPSLEKQTKTRAQVEIKQLFVDVVVSGYDYERASGPLAVVDLLDELRQEVTMAAGDEAGTQVYADGTGNGGLDLDGARVGVGTSANYATYAGISRATNTWWDANLNATGGQFTSSIQNTDYGNAEEGNAHPTLEVTTQALWNKVLDRASALQRYDAGNEANRTAKIGFDAIKHLGADLVHDSHCPAGNVWYFNMDTIELRVINENRMWGWTGWKTPASADLQQGQLLFMGNLLFKAPRLNSRATGMI